MRPRTFAFPFFRSPDVGIDLGTTHTTVWVPGRGVVLREPSVVAVDAASAASRAGPAVGALANLMHGRAPDSAQILRPVVHGAVSDAQICEVMLRSFLERAVGRRWLMPRALVSVSAATTPVERQALVSTVARAGARQVHLIDKAKAAALGVGLPLAEPVASMICDLGGGTTEIAVLSLGDIVVHESLRSAGDCLDRAIAEFLRRQHKLRVGKQTAERIKLQIGSAVLPEGGAEMEVCGSDVVSGLPRRARLTGDEVHAALEQPVRWLIDALERTLERCHPELCSDLMQNGLVLAGGGAQLRGLDSRLAEATGMPVRVAEDPETSVARGLGTCLEHLDTWHTLIEGRRAA